MLFPVSRLMGSTAASANMGHGLNTGMPGLGACAVPDSKPMQFPLAQRRKRRVLFTQAQVGETAAPVMSPTPPGLTTNLSSSPRRNRCRKVFKSTVFDGKSREPTPKCETKFFVCRRLKNVLMGEIRVIRSKIVEKDYHYLILNVKSVL